MTPLSQHPAPHPWRARLLTFGGGVLLGSVLCAALVYDLIIGAANADVLTQPAAAPTGPLASFVEPIKVGGKLPLAMLVEQNVPLRTLTTSKQRIDTLHFEKIATPAQIAAEHGATLATGALSWTVTAKETRVFDGQTGLSSTTPVLRADNIRPQEAIMSQRQGEVWFYGEELYRYHAATHALDRFRPTTESLGIIRKALAAPSGLWLATERGVFFLDEEKETLKKFDHPQSLADGKFTHAVLAADGVWFAGDGPRLVKIFPRTVDAADIAVSAKLPLGAPAQMVIAGDELWMLTSKNHGDSYQLVFVGPGLDALNIVPGKYFSLQQDHAQLLASAYETVYSINTAAKTLTKFKIDASKTLLQTAMNRRVLFVGTSYGIKDGSEVVEHSRVDISKGWTQPHLEWLGLPQPVDTALSR